MRGIVPEKSADTKAFQLHAVIDSVNFAGTFREAFPQLPRGKVAHGDDRARCGKDARQANDKVSRRENVVRVRCQAKLDPEKLVQPKRGARGHAGKVRMDPREARALHSQAHVRRLVKAEEIRLPAPALQRLPDGARQLGPLHFLYQDRLLREVLHPGQHRRVPGFRRFILRLPDREHGDLDALPEELRDFAIREILPERREAFEKVSHAQHGQTLAEDRRG